MQANDSNTPEGRGTANLLDVAAGLGIVVLCAAAVWSASSYGLGSARRMGAGYFPVALGLIGILLGLALTVRAVRHPRTRGPSIPLRRLLCIPAAFLLFALLIEPAGLLITILLTTLLASLADPDSRLHQSVALGTGLAVFVWLVFVVALGLSVPVWPGGA